MHILFVCTGNICRSPTAERLAAASGGGLEVSSAGTHAVIGHPVHPEAARVLAALGGDPAGFAARQLTPAIAAGADLVLGMTRAHRDAVLEVAPRQLHRTFTLSEAAALITRFTPGGVAELSALRPRLGIEEAPDVADPIGQSEAVFAAVGARIAELVGPVAAWCASDPQ